MSPEFEIFDKWLPVLRKGTRKSFDLDLKKPTDHGQKKKVRDLKNLTFQDQDQGDTFMMGVSFLNVKLIF